MPDTPTVVVGVVVALVVGMLFLQPVITAADEHTGSIDISNESVTAVHDEYVDLDGYNIDENSETVWGYNDTSSSYEQAPASDYTMDYDSGAINVSSSSTLIQDGEEIKVSYTYQASDGTTALIAGFVPIMLVLLLFVSVAMEVTNIL